MQIRGGQALTQLQVEHFKSQVLGAADLLLCSGQTRVVAVVGQEGEQVGGQSHGL